VSNHAFTPGQKELVRKVTSGAADIATEFKKTLNLDVYVQTIRNMLTKEGLKSTVGQKLPFLSKARRQARQDFALEHQHWTLEVYKGCLVR
jgi:Transposase